MPIITNYYQAINEVSKFTPFLEFFEAFKRHVCQKATIENVYYLIGYYKYKITDKQYKNFMAEIREIIS